MDKRPGMPAAILLSCRKPVRGWNQYIRTKTQNEKTDEAQERKTRPWRCKPLDQRAPKPEPLLGLQLPHSHALCPPTESYLKRGPPQYGLKPSCRLLDTLNNFTLGPAFLNEVLWNHGAGLWAKMCVAATSTCAAVQIPGALWVKPVGTWTQRLTGRARAAVAWPAGGTAPAQAVWGARLSLQPSYGHLHESYLWGLLELSTVTTGKYKHTHCNKTYHGILQILQRI